MTFEITQEVRDALEALLSAERVFLTETFLAEQGAWPGSVMVAMVEDEDGSLSPVAVVVDADLFSRLSPPEDAPVGFDVSDLEVADSEGDVGG